MTRGGAALWPNPDRAVSNPLQQKKEGGKGRRKKVIGGKERGRKGIGKEYQPGWIGTSASCASVFCSFAHILG